MKLKDLIMLNLALFSFNKFRKQEANDRCFKAQLLFMNFN